MSLFERKIAGDLYITARNRLLNHRRRIDSAIKNDREITTNILRRKSRKDIGATTVKPDFDIWSFHAAAFPDPRVGHYITGHQHCRFDQIWRRASSLRRSIKNFITRRRPLPNRIGDGVFVVEQFELEHRGLAD